MFSFEPGIVDDGKIRAREATVEFIAADAAPRRVVIRAAVVNAGARDVEQLGKVLADPGPAVVLIGDRIDAQLGDEPLQLFGRARRAHFPQRLREHIRPTPHWHPQRPRVFAIDRLDQQFRGRRVLALADGVTCRNRDFLRRSPHAAHPRSEIRVRAIRGCRAPWRRHRRSRGCATPRSCSSDAPKSWRPSPSTSHWFEYTRNRTIDMASSGSFSMSVSTNTRGFSAAPAKLLRLSAKTLSNRARKSRRFIGLPHS